MHTIHPAPASASSDVHPPMQDLLAQERSISSSELESRYATASALLMAGEGQEALADLAWLVAHNPWDARFEFAFALALQFAGQFERAAMHYLQVQLLDPDHAGGALRLAECLESLGEHMASAEAYRRCVQISWKDTVHADIRCYAEAGLDRLVKGEEIGWP